MRREIIVDRVKTFLESDRRVIAAAKTMELIPSPTVVSTRVKPWDFFVECLIFIFWYRLR
jgi:hypothetical protein